jgi:hypothetical protein
MAAVIGGLALVSGTVSTGAAFMSYFALNSSYVYLQPLQMARWLEANTPADAVVAVHDTGMMRYLGERTTIDIVGLTTPGAAAAWRNGPGAVAEFLDSTRPDYIASYGRGHGFGLGYLADTSLYAQPLLEIPIPLNPYYNVALAADVQGIYQPDWTAADRGRDGAYQPVIYEAAGRTRPLLHLDVADLASERAAKYTWRNGERLGGFPGDVYEMEYVACAVESCRVLDGGRFINGEEAFTFIPPDTPIDVLLVTRLHPVTAGTLDVYVGDTKVATRLIPALPGAWLEVATRIPAGQLAAPTRIRIVPSTPGGYYQPYHHWIYPAIGDTTLPQMPPFATFGEAIRLYEPLLTLAAETRQLAVTLHWGSEGAAGDAKIFIHVLDETGATVAQADIRPGGGALPPGNWLPGVFAETIMVDLSAVAPGRYRVVMGLYDPLTFARIPPSGGDEAQRLNIGEVEITGDG